MLTQEAGGKDCPFKSNMVSEQPAANMTGVTIPGWFYCNTTLCMSWENTGVNNEGLETGYCKLIEAQFPKGE